MKTYSLKDLSLLLGGQLSDSKYEDLSVKSFSTDTRSLKEGDLFIPLAGENFDAHTFIDLAIEKGAIASLSSDKNLVKEGFPIIYLDDSLLALEKIAQDYRESLDQLKLIAISGSNGKTSTKDMLASILSSDYKVQATKENFNNEIGVALTLLSLEEDTDIALVELGIGDKDQMRELSHMAQPDMAIITNISQAHLWNFDSQEEIGQEKMEMLKDMKKPGFYLYYGDDPILKKLRPEEPGFEIRSFGENEDNDVIIEDFSYDKEGSEVRLNIYDNHKFHIPLLGRHQVYNGACAIALAYYLNIDKAKVQKGLDQTSLTPLRNQIIREKGLLILNDAYKSNPLSLDMALESFSLLGEFDRKIAVIGDMLGLGEIEIEEHKKIGAKLLNYNFDYIFLVGNLVDYTYQELIKSFPQERIFKAQDKFDLLDDLVKLSKPGSGLVFKATRSFQLEDLIDSLLQSI